MTVSDVTGRDDYIGNASTKIFPYTFKIFWVTGIEVLLDGVTQTTGYSVSGFGLSGGGYVTFTTAPALGVAVTLLRNQPVNQSSDYWPNEGFPSGRLETDLDKLAMQVQMLREQLVRTPKLGKESIITDIALPPLAANQYIGWNSSADGLENKVASTITLGELAVIGDYSDNLAAAISTIGATKKLLIINKAITLTASATVPSTLSIWITMGGIITKASTYTLAINGSFEAGPYQVFSGFASGDVTFGAGAVAKIYPEWWGIDGTADDVEINAAIQSLTLGTVALAKTLYLTSGTINMKSGVNLIGPAGGFGGPDFHIIYSGADSTIKFSGVTDSTLSQLNIRTDNAAANGIEAGDASLRINLEKLYIQVKGSETGSATGAGIYLNAGTGWSGGIGIRDCYVLAHKYGVKMVGTVLATDTWTTVDMTNLWLVGRSAGRIAGSAGIYMDALTNGVGTYLRGGTIESFAIGIQHINGGWGGFFEADMEDNITNYSVGASFNGEIIVPVSNNYFRQGSNSGENNWFRERHLNGEYVKETYYSQRHVLFGTNNTEFSVHMGSSIIDEVMTPSPASELFGIHTSGGTISEHGSTNFMRLFGNHKIIFDTAAPTTGSWNQGDRVFSLAAAVGQPSGWVCTHAGTFEDKSVAGTATNGSPTITEIADTSSLKVGMFVTVSARWASLEPHEIMSIVDSIVTPATPGTVTFAASDVANDSGAVTITTTDPTFTAMANLS